MIFQTLICIYFRYKENPTQKDILDIFLKYNQLRIMITMFNNAYSSAYYPMVNTVLGTLTILGVFMALKLLYLKSVLITGFGIMTIFCCGILLVVITSLTATVNENSTQYRQFLIKDKVYSQQFARKHLKAYKLMSIRCGEYYDIRKITSLTLLGMVINIAGSLLISIKI